MGVVVVAGGGAVLLLQYNYYYYYNYYFLELESLLIQVFLLGRLNFNLISKSLKLHHFKLNRDEIWQDCSLSKY